MRIPVPAWGRGPFDRGLIAAPAAAVPMAQDPRALQAM